MPSQKWKRGVERAAGPSGHWRRAPASPQSQHRPNVMTGNGLYQPRAPSASNSPTSTSSSDNTGAQSLAVFLQEPKQVRKARTGPQPQIVYYERPRVPPRPNPRAQNSNQFSKPRAQPNAQVGQVGQVHTGAKYYQTPYAGPSNAGNIHFSATMGSYPAGGATFVTPAHGMGMRPIQLPENNPVQYQDQLNKPELRATPPGQAPTLLNRGSNLSQGPFLPQNPYPSSNGFRQEIPSFVPPAATWHPAPLPTPTAPHSSFANTWNNNPTPNVNIQTTVATLTQNLAIQDMTKKVDEIEGRVNILDQQMGSMMQIEIGKATREVNNGGDGEASTWRRFPGGGLVLYGDVEVSPVSARNVSRFERSMKDRPMLKRRVSL